DAEQSLWLILFAKRLQRGANFGRMMAVIIDDDRAVASADFAHPTIDADECADRVGGLLRAHADGNTGSDGHGGVDQVVLAGDGKADGGEGFVVEGDGAVVAAVGDVGGAGGPGDGSRRNTRGGAALYRSVV